MNPLKVKTPKSLKKKIKYEDLKNFFLDENMQDEANMCHRSRSYFYL